MFEPPDMNPGKYRTINGLSVMMQAHDMAMLTSIDVQYIRDELVYVESIGDEVSTSTRMTRRSMETTQTLGELSAICFRCRCGWGMEMSELTRNPR